LNSYFLRKNIKIQEKGGQLEGMKILQHRKKMNVVGRYKREYHFKINLCLSEKPDNDSHERIC